MLMYMHYFFIHYSSDLKSVAVGGLPTSRKLARTFGDRARLVVLIGAAMLSTAACKSRLDDRISDAFALGRRPTESKKQRIEALAHDDDRDIRATALVVMDSVDHVRAKKIAAEALQDPDGLIRAAAVMVLGREPDTEMIHVLAALAIVDPMWQVRARAIDAIGAADDPKALESIAQAVSDPVRHVRRAALEVGVERPGLLPTEAVTSLLKGDPDWENRVQAALVLGGSTDPAAYPALEAAVEDSNEFVRAAASRGLRRLAEAGVDR